MDSRFYIWILAFLSYLFGLFVGFILTRRSLKARYESMKPMGVLRIVYDPDSPETPAMGLEIESLSYILHSRELLLKVDKKNFPSNDKRVVLESSKDKSA